MRMIITKIIHKFLGFKKYLKFKSTNEKHALISYVLFPPSPFDFKFVFKTSHNRFLKCYLMTKVLKARGYDVHVYDYTNTKIDFSIDYEVFIGHNKTFSIIAEFLNKDCKKILLTTGSSPYHDNKILFERQDALQALKSTKESFFSPIDNIDWVDKNFKIADNLLMLGNDVILKTWPYFDPKKVFFYNNVTYIDFKIKKERKGNFLYLSSIGQLRRGLDLIIESFKGKNEKIYICGPYDEPAFMKYYSIDLEQNKNIVLVGFIDQTSARFNEIIDDCDFGILPSASEAISGSVLTMMSHGLIPVITPQIGYLCVDEYGILIKHPDYISVKNSVEKAIELTDEEVFLKRNKLLEQSKYYNVDYFLSNFESFCKKNI